MASRPHGVVESGVTSHDAPPTTPDDTANAANVAPPTSHDAPPPITKWRNIIGFWLIGLANNYPYVIMLSAAYDIIQQLEGSSTHSNATNTSDPYNDSCTLVSVTANSSSYKPRDLCQHQGTAVILLADILPTLLIKITAPYWMHFVPYWIRVLSVVLFSLASFLLIALSSVEPVVLLGVVCASIASGFGELVFLSLTSRYHVSTVTAWSSGTGAAGVAGALVYAGLRTFLSPKVTLLIQICVPLLLLVSYLLILGASKPAALPEAPAAEQGEGVIQTEDGGERKGRISPLEYSQSVTDTDPLIQNSSRVCQRKHTPAIQLLNREEAKHWLSHVKYIPHLFKYMLPLFLVYYAEYAINQGFFELLYSPNTHVGSYCLDQSTQYRWLQVLYQVGVLLSRSSVGLVHIRHYWVLALLQVANFVFFFCASIYLFLPSFWLTFVLVLYEGLLGGAVYVNAFYTISKDVPAFHREFSLSVASVADSFGISLAGVSAIFIHQYICTEFIDYVES